MRPSTLGPCASQAAVWGHTSCETNAGLPAIGELNASALEREAHRVDRYAARIRATRLEVSDRIAAHLRFFREFRDGPAEKPSSGSTLFLGHETDDITRDGMRGFTHKPCARRVTVRHARFKCTLTNMSIIPKAKPTDAQLRALEHFDRSLDRVLDAEVHPACLHAVIDNRPTRIRAQKRPALEPNGWETIPGAPADPFRRVTPGTPEAHAELFAEPERFDRKTAAARLREFRSSAAAATEAGWSREDLHRTIDAGYWSMLGEMYERAGEHAWRAKIGAPRPRAA